jgi:DNA-directed RNA polymerase subunit M/transcription elongation factor TFIIS
MKIDALKNVDAPSGEARHKNVILFSKLMPIHVAHELESHCWSVCHQKGDRSLGTYLQNVIRMHHNITQKPALMTEYSTSELLILDHKSLNMGHQSEFERLTEAKQKVDKALTNLNINFDMTMFKPMIRCRYCGESKDMVVSHAQRRKADEGMTEIKKCNACNEEWT